MKDWVIGRKERREVRKKGRKAVIDRRLSFIRGKRIPVPDKMSKKTDLILDRVSSDWLRNDF